MLTLLLKAVEEGDDSYSRVARSGSYLLRTEYGDYSSTGIVDISTASAREEGISGDVDLSTGTSSYGNTGYVNVETASRPTATLGTATYSSVPASRPSASTSSRAAA